MQAIIEKCPSRVIAHRALGQAEVGIIDYRWQESFIYQDQLNSIHYRLMPFHLDMQGSLSGRAEHHLGNLSMLPAGSTLRVLGDGPVHRARTLKCSFAPSWVEQLLGHALDTDDLDIDNFLGVKNAHARACLHRISLELIEPGIGSDALIESLLQTAVIEIIRDTSRTPTATFHAERSNSARLSSAQLDRVTAMLEEGHDSIPSASALARELGMSVSHFRRRFRATTGQSVHEFISNSIVEHAKGLLANSHLSMKEITYRLGFTSPSSFSVAFKRVVGCSPSHFRLHAQA